MLDLLYPRRCPVCSKVVREDYELTDDKHTMPRGIGMEKLICPHCYEKLTFVDGKICITCGHPINAGEYCRNCRERTHAFNDNRGMLDYANAYADKIMWDLKYNNRQEYANFLGLEMARRYSRKIKMNGIQVIVPVPVHPERLRKRGYNQAELVANYLGEYLDIPVVPELLKRDKKTKPQKELSVYARYQNLQNAFVSVPEAFRLRNVLVVDDIYTTGATLNACSLALKACGVKNVYGLSCSIGRNDA